MQSKLRVDDSVRAETCRDSVHLVPAATLSRIGALLADETRCLVLQALMDGRAWTAGELARYAGVAPSTVSEHLSRLLDAQFVSVEAQGRHRYFRLSGSGIAELLESLGSLPLPTAAIAARAPVAPSELRYARSCYDHLAGQLGVELYNRLLSNGHLERIDDVTVVTPTGDALLGWLGVDATTYRQGSRAAARSCLDWTERRHHLAGGAGAALLQTLLERHWLTRGRRPRSILVTNGGQQGLRDFFQLCEATAGGTQELRPTLALGLPH
jgi:DNA-binding transcriptional ArsR family regulator